MVQKPRFKDMPTKSRDWLEVECLKLLYALEDEGE
jgi:hypothetical protein